MVRFNNQEHNFEVTRQPKLSSLHCSAPEQSTISLMLAARNGGLPER
jgi:hypothetical protein